MRMSILFAVCCLLFLFSACNSPSTDYHSIAYQDALQAGIPAQYFVNQIQVESGFNPNTVSSAGAVGIAQFLPSTAQGLGIDPYNPIDALRGAANLMSHYQAQYGDYQHALAAYNCGTGCLESAMQNCSDYYWCLPTETEQYMDAIMRGAA